MLRSDRDMGQFWRDKQGLCLDFVVSVDFTKEVIMNRDYAIIDGSRDTSDETSDT